MSSHLKFMDKSSMKIRLKDEGLLYTTLLVLLKYDSFHLTFGFICSPIDRVPSTIMMGLRSFLYVDIVTLSVCFVRRSFSGRIYLNVCNLTSSN